MNFYSQNGQDKFIASLFRNKKGGVFVDIGAYDGLNLSNTIYFEKYLNWTGICIEPNPEVFKELKNNRNCNCLNYCVNDKKGVFKFLSVSGYGVMLSGLMDCFDKRHLERIDKIIIEHGGEKSIINIPAFPLKDIFQQYSIIEIDYCNIDVEGGEINVLNSIDFSKVKIKVFTIENNYRTKTIRNFLSAKGYNLISRLGADEVYEHQSKRYGLMLQWRISKIKNYIILLWRSAKRKIINPPK
ncbi:MAG: FkbM family methyltransferase [Bacteroidota bacterium]|nr:FkbM family methyltransferase [Bacteroidota bacterium]